VLGDVEGAGLLFDAAMVVVPTDEVSPIVAGTVHCAVIESCIASFDVRRAAEWTAALSTQSRSRHDDRPPGDRQPW
jgi:hypothetical protein